VEHYASRIDITISQAIRAAFHLANAFHALHSKGLCYKDISLGNLFLDPGSGRILICDNDNVDVDGRGLGSVLGTPGFMAPEILMRKARPGANSDLFSLAVLIFRLLTRHDPLKGQMELEIRCLDEPARRRLYGEDPVFIFDPRDQRNRPDPQLHSAALITWPIYPSELQNLFLQTFSEGMHNPARRALTGQWREVLARSLDQRRRCTGCGQETFGAGPTCWNCGTPIPTGPAMVTDHARVAICAENQLHPHHFNRLEPPELDHPIAQVVSHPTDPELLGLRNLSDAPWRATLSNGSQVGVQPKQSCNLAILEHLQTPLGSVRMERTTR
jgi:serine/threonine protein kinase